MNITQKIEAISPRPKLRLAEIEKLLRIHRIIVPIPSRSTLTEMCEEGTLETAPREFGKRRFQWMVYEDSFIKWIKSMEIQK